jgi:DNA-binding Lrp family transcriptional regulator
MSRAFVMVNADPGFESELQSELKKLEGVVWVYQVYGVYDLVVQVEAGSDQKLKDVMLSRIRPLRHVRSTLTLTTTG